MHYAFLLDLNICVKCIIHSMEHNATTFTFIAGIFCAAKCVIFAKTMRRTSTEYYVI